MVPFLSFLSLLVPLERLELRDLIDDYLIVRSTGSFRGRACFHDLQLGGSHVGYFNVVKMVRVARLVLSQVFLDLFMLRFGMLAGLETAH